VHCKLRLPSTLDGDDVGRSSASARHPPARDRGRCDVGCDVRHRFDDVRQEICRDEEGEFLGTACLIRVSTWAFVRISRIVRMQNPCKFFVFNNTHWFESNPLRLPQHQQPVNTAPFIAMEA
jgi:hypothetical protein